MITGDRAMGRQWVARTQKIEEQIGDGQNRLFFVVRQDGIVAIPGKRGRRKKPEEADEFIAVIRRQASPGRSSLWRVRFSGAVYLMSRSISLLSFFRTGVLSLMLSLLCESREVAG
jgi:hypothetical protein